jgi:hypothetical protein
MINSKKYISFFLSLVIGLFTMKSFLVMSYYIVFTDTFIENYCVNKDKPKLNCDGKCELSKLLERNSDESEDQEKMMLISSSELIFYFDYSTFEFSNFNKNLSNTTGDFIPQLYTFNFIEKQIKPPIHSI